jgi:hypothetical protein
MLLYSITTVGAIIIAISDIIRKMSQSLALHVYIK